MDNNSKIRDLKLELEKITVKFISRGLDIKLLHAHVRCEAAHLELIILRKNISLCLGKILKYPGTLG